MIHSVSAVPVPEAALEDDVEAVGPAAPDGASHVASGARAPPLHLDVPGEAHWPACVRACVHVRGLVCEVCVSSRVGMVSAVRVCVGVCVQKWS